ncbi:CidA/LrgA family protein [Litorivicinus sp.]|nr:CidA/LrgA family protein [Litorivicinus sp.]MDC1240196.1 CidA/LrgA family protein [Litorivicinus sp.]
MLVALTQLLFCQLAGEVIARAFDLAVPGPVIGMGLLLAILLYRSNVPEHLDSTATGILSHLSLLFVPAGVGVVAHLGVLGNEWQAILGSLVGSTIATVLVTGWVLQKMHRRHRDAT